LPREGKTASETIIEQMDEALNEWLDRIERVSSDREKPIDLNR
jgi:hypothetical protein